MKTYRTPLAALNDKNKKKTLIPLFVRRISKLVMICAVRRDGVVASSWKIQVFDILIM